MENANKQILDNKLSEQVGLTVQIFVPCFIDQLYPSVAFNMVKVLEKAGCTVSYNGNQTCSWATCF